MELNIPKKSETKMISGFRVSNEVYSWIKELSDEYGATIAKVLKHILQKVYNDEMRAMRGKLPDDMDEVISVPEPDPDSPITTIRFS